MHEKIVELLSQTEDYISGQELSTQLGVSRQAVWKAINTLKSQGYVFDSITRKGYKLVAYPEHLNTYAVKSHLNTNLIGKNLIVLDSVTSTNDYLKTLGAEGCESGTLVAAREQTKGKGRLGRVWQTKKDDGIAFSFLLRPDLAPNEITGITPLAGLAVCKAIRDYTGIDCKIKWPNDIITGHKKLVGILTELSAEFSAVEYTITGIGINVEHTQFPQEIAHKATSIFLETGKHIDRNEFLAVVIEYLERKLLTNDLRLTEKALEEYTSLCATIGRNVSFFRNSQQMNGVAEKIDNNGELVVKLEDGTLHTVNSGEVTVQGIY